MAKDDLTDIFISNGVNEDAKPFLTVAVHTGDQRVFLAQMSPDEVRHMAMAWLEAAEAAEQDAATLRVIRKLEMPDELAGAVIVELRNMRKDGDAE